MSKAQKKVGKVMVDTKGMTYLPIYEFAKAIESKIKIYNTIIFN